MNYIVFVLFILIALSAVKIFWMNTIWGKLLAANIFSSNITALVIVFSMLLGKTMYLDLIITYLLLNFVGTVLFTKYIQSRRRGV